MTSSSREVWLKIERLDETDRVIEEKTRRLLGGRVEISGTGENRRKITFQLLEPLAVAWQSYRWKVYYGYRSRTGDQIEYYPQGVFLPMNPTESEIEEGYTSDMQGADKMKMFYDYEIDEPVTFASGTAVRQVVQDIAGWFDETRLKLDTDLGTLGANLTFEEGTTAGSMLSTLMSSFSAEAFYDVEGYLVARKIVDPRERPVKYVVDDQGGSVYISSKRTVDDTNYYNSVTVVGGTVDTDIFRAHRNSPTAIAEAKRVVQRYFTVDAAVTQVQVDARADHYLSMGVSLPRRISLVNLVLPDIDAGDVIEKAGVKYEVVDASIPLDLSTQGLSAREVL